MKLQYASMASGKVARRLLDVFDGLSDPEPIINALNDIFGSS